MQLPECVWLPLAQMQLVMSEDEAKSHSWTDRANIQREERRGEERVREMVEHAILKLGCALEENPSFSI